MSIQPTQAIYDADIAHAGNMSMRQCVRTHFWHLASMSPDILGLGKTLSGEPQDMDKEEGDMLCLR